MHGEEAPNPRHDQNPALWRRVAKQKEGSWETAWASYRGIINPWPWVWYDIPVFLIPTLPSLLPYWLLFGSIIAASRYRLVIREFLSPRFKSLRTGVAVRSAPNQRSTVCSFSPSWALGNCFLIFPSIYNRSCIFFFSSLSFTVPATCYCVHSTRTSFSMYY